MNGLINFKRRRALDLLAAASAAGLVCLVAGCSSGSKTAASSEKVAPVVKASSLSPVEISSLRERAIQIVEECATSTDPTLRANAAEAAINAPSRLRRVIDASLADKNPGVRGVAASALGLAKLPEFGATLMSLTQDSNAAVRVSAIYAVLATGGEVDRSPLATALLKDPSASVKRQAADALGLLGDRSATGLLRAAAKEKFPELPPAQVRLLHLQIAEALVKLGDDSQRPVIRAALYPSQPDELEAAVLAVQIIGTIQDKESAAQLVGLADYKDRAGQQYPPEVRLAIAATLAQLGMPEGSFVAEQYVGNASPSVRAQVAFVYGQTKGAKNGARLAQLMEAPEPQVRIAAAAAVLRSLSRK